jgi:hypothetical protein
MAVDVGGSGMRTVLSRDGINGEVRTDAGARIAAGRLDVGVLAAVVGSLLPADIPVDVLVFAARGIVALADPADVLLRLGSLGARRTVVCSGAVTSLIGAVGGVWPGAVIAAGTGAVAFDPTSPMSTGGSTVGGTCWASAAPRPGSGSKRCAS